jgi:hypothetical protein
MPRKSFSPAIGEIYGFAESPVQSTKNCARVTLPSLACIKLCTRDAGVEPDVTAEIELLVDVVEIGAKLLPRGIELTIIPIPPELLAGELIQRPVRIDPGARITVPVPDAADVGPGLEYLHVVTELAQVSELVEAGEPGADHQRVQLLDRFLVRRLCEPRCVHLGLPSCCLIDELSQRLENTP